MKVVLDTNILVSALMSRDNASRAVIRMALEGMITPLVGNALFCEYESLIARDYLFKHGPLDRQARDMFLGDVLSVCQWVDIHYLWRPNLRDEGDNHVIELAVAGGAPLVITQNLKDFYSGDLQRFGVDMIHPHDFLQGWRDKKWQH